MSYDNYEFITKSIDIDIFISMAIEGKMSCYIPIGSGKVRKIINGVDYGEVDEDIIQEGDIDSIGK